MKIFLFVGVLLLGSFGWSYGQQDPKIDCTMWGAWNNEQKTLYLAGYSDAIGMIGFAVAVGGRSPDEIKKVIHAMWPEGYNLGNLGDELDKLCQKDPFKKMRLSLVISGIAGKEARAKQ